MDISFSCNGAAGVIFAAFFVRVDGVKKREFSHNNLTSRKIAAYFGPHSFANARNAPHSFADHFYTSTKSTAHALMERAFSCGLIATIIAAP